MPRQFYPLSQELLDSIPEKVLDLPYCTDSPLQVLDLYLPNPSFPRPCPLIIHTHGGAFANGDQRETHTEPMLKGLDRGYAVASVQYRRSREAFFPAQVLDVKAAIRFLRAKASCFGLDADRFALWGASSGAWLSSMVAVTEGNPAFEDPGQGNALVSSAVQAVIDWCGPCGGFLEMDKAFSKSGLGEATHDRPDSPESRFMGRAITEIPELCRLACPCTYVHPDVPPFLIIHGGSDQVVPVEQSVTFWKALTGAAGEERARLHIVEGKLHHGDPWYHEPWVVAECLDFLDDILERKGSEDPGDDLP